MSDLRPRGVPVMVEGVERHFLFTLNVIDEIQDHYDLPLLEALNYLTNERTKNKALKYIVVALLNDEAEREKAAGKEPLKEYTEQEIGWIIDEDNHGEYLVAILQAYGVSLPEPDGESDPNQLSGRTGE